MGLFSELWEGTKDVLKGAGNMIVGIFQMAFAAAVWIVKTIFTAAIHLTQFAIEVAKSLIGTNKKVETVEFAGKKTTQELYKMLQEVKEKNGVVIGDEIDLAGKGIMFSESINEKGERELEDARIVEAYDFEDKINEADERGRIYVAPVKC